MVDPTPTKPLTLRVTPELKSRLRSAAGRHDRSMNEHAVILLDDALRFDELAKALGSTGEHPTTTEGDPR